MANHTLFHTLRRMIQMLSRFVVWRKSPSIYSGVLVFMTMSPKLSHAFFVIVVVVYNLHLLYVS